METKDIILELRTEKGLSQDELAEKIGFDYKQGFLYGKIGKLS